MVKEKIKFLDGIRGIMAFNVVICHFVCIYYPQMYFVEYAQKIRGGGVAIFANSPLSILVNGDIAVRYFFVLTGFLVARGILTGKKHEPNSILTKSVNRYLRLLPVVIAATAFSYLTMVLGLQHHLNILDKAANVEMLASNNNFAPTFTRFLLNAVYEPFVLEGSDFIRPFWMLRFELWGYILSMLTCYFLKDSRVRRIGYIAVAILMWITLDENYMGFFMGIFVADLYYCTESDTSLFSKFYGSWIRKKLVLVPLTAVGFYLACCPMEFVGIYAMLAKIPKITTYTPRAAGVAMLLFCLLQMPSLWKFFEGKLLQFLGKISFSLFAFHWPIMLTLEAWLFDCFYGKLSYDVAAVLAFVISVPVIIFTAWLSWRFLEQRIKWNAGPVIQKTSIC